MFKKISEKLSNLKPKHSAEDFLSPAARIAVNAAVLQTGFDHYFIVNQAINLWLKQQGFNQIPQISGPLSIPRHLRKKNK